LTISERRTSSNPSRVRWELLGVLALVLCAAVAMTLAGSADAKKAKKPKTARFFQQSVAPNAAIPQDAGTGPSTPLNTTITVGKKFKDRVVGDVNVTGIQTTGSGGNAAGDLVMRLIAPNGQGVLLIGSFLEGANIGPLTFDDDVFVEICYTSPPCDWAPQTLDPPYAGSASLLYNGAAGTGPLAQLNGTPMRGTWTLSVWDEAGPTTTSVLNGWGLQITARKPVT
jgi:subtilisin-like proprotein convertase family protein